MSHPELCKITLKGAVQFGPCDVARVHGLNGDLDSESLKEIGE